jgi:hypothetical protein
LEGVWVWGLVKERGDSGGLFEGCLGSFLKASNGVLRVGYGEEKWEVTGDSSFVRKMSWGRERGREGVWGSGEVREVWGGIAWGVLDVGCASPSGCEPCRLGEEVEGSRVAFAGFGEEINGGGGEDLADGSMARARCQLR